MERQRSDASANLAALTTAIEAGDRAAATVSTRWAVDARLDPRLILDAMTAGMETVGERFQQGEIFVPEMLIAARAMTDAMRVLEPVLVDAGVRPEHTAVIGTVKGDLHDIGKNLVAMMWRGAHIDVIDLGTDVPPDRFVEAAREHNASIVGVSALLTTTMEQMRDVVAAIRAADLVSVKVIVGGAPVTAEFAARIGADAFAPDASLAVDAVRKIMAAG